MKSTGKRKNNLNFIKIKNFVHQKLNEKEQPTEWENICNSYYLIRDNIQKNIKNYNNKKI